MSIWDDPSEVQGKSAVESMFYVTSEGEPWHGLGTSVTEALTSADAYRMAGQDWTVRKEPIQTVSGIPITGAKSYAVVREDKGIALGVVGNRYKPIQNREAFDFLDSLAANRTIRYHTAGVLGQGERIWILAQLHGDIIIPKSEDIIKKFLLFSNTHDGGGAGRCFWTPIRVVCQNTLNQATGNAKGEGITIRHSGNLRSKIAEAQRILALSVKAYDDLEGQIFATAKAKISDSQRKAYFDTIYGAGGKANDEDGKPADVSTRTRNVLDRLERLFVEGKGNDARGVRGSVWAAYNAVTEFTDFHRPTRVEGDPATITDLDRRSKRLESIWFGNSARLKEKAWELAKDIVGVN